MADLGYANVDLQRRDRCGFPEVVYAEGKTAEWLEGVETIALTAGASAPEILVEQAIDFLRDKGFTKLEEVEVMPENVRFGLPPEIVAAIASAPAATAGD